MQNVLICEDWIYSSDKTSKMRKFVKQWRCYLLSVGDALGGELDFECDDADEDTFLEGTVGDVPDVSFALSLGDAIDVSLALSVRDVMEVSFALSLEGILIDTLGTKSDSSMFSGGFLISESWNIYQNSISYVTYTASIWTGTIS